MIEDPSDRLLAHDVDEPVPAEHEQRIRAALGALRAAPAVKPDAPPGAPPATPAAAPPAALTASTKLAVVLLVGAGVGLGFVAGRATAPTAAVPVPATTAAPASEVPSVATAASPTALPSSAPSASVRTLPSSAVSVSHPSTPAGDQDAFDREQSLLEQARSALVRHDAPAAAQALAEAERRFPQSRQAEERDYLRIQLLREQGDTAKARERAQAFLTKYPTSILRGRVEKLLEE